MLVDAYMKCYRISEDAYEIIPKHCPLDKEICSSGNQYVGESEIKFVVVNECEYYDNDSFKSYDGCIECNFNEIGGYE
jgi:hypothetical protein